MRNHRAKHSFAKHMCYCRWPREVQLFLVLLSVRGVYCWLNQAMIKNMALLRSTFEIRVGPSVSMSLHRRKVKTRIWDERNRLETRIIVSVVQGMNCPYP